MYLCIDLQRIILILLMNMKIKIESNFHFSVSSIHYLPNGELQILLCSKNETEENRYEYAVQLGEGEAEKRPTIKLSEYVCEYLLTAAIKDKTRQSYMLMSKHLEVYGDCYLHEITTAYLQEFIHYLQKSGLKAGTVRLYFQKLACVLHDAYKNELFDDRILKRVKRPKREQERRCYLSESELKRLSRKQLPERYDNIRNMFLFSCMTGLRYSDIQGLKWKDVKRNGKHLQLEFHQQKTDTFERLPLCAEAEALLRSMSRHGANVFKEESNPKVNMALKHWCRDAKIKKPISFHCARHTFCVLLLTKEVPIYTVQQLMCHTDINSTKIYADILSKTKTRAVKKIPRFMS